MSLILLLDLDDTLIHNSMDSFIPAYLKAISRAVKNLVAPEKFAAALLKATNKAIHNNDPSKTLKQVFDENFYDSCGVNYNQIQPFIDAFYSKDFSKLRELTQQKPEALHLVKEASKRGFQVVLATNPLFPKTAILQRLEWAGLNQDDFILIPSYETFHFAKPNPAYFAEILANLAWSESPVLMVGDDLKNDIVPTARMNIPNFWISGDNGKRDQQSFAMNSGNLEDIIPWIDETGVKNLFPDRSRLHFIKATLQSSPAVIHDITIQVSNNQWNLKNSSDAWSLTEILCHLRDVDQDVNIPRVQKVLTEESPFIVGIDTDSWSEEKHYNNQDGKLSLKTYINNRKQLLELLLDLPAKTWSRPAWHSIFGPTTLHELAQFMAGHDRLHVKQIINTVKSLN